MLRPYLRAVAFCAALAVSALAATGSCYRIADAGQVTGTPGLAPQFSRWPVPLYTSNVKSSTTWAPVSYEIMTKDSKAHVIAWYLATLKGRAMRLHPSAPASRPAQIAVDGGSYIINLLKSPDGTSINVIKNGGAG